MWVLGSKSAKMNSPILAWGLKLNPRRNFGLLPMLNKVTLFVFASEWWVCWCASLVARFSLGLLNSSSADSKNVSRRELGQKYARKILAKSWH